MRREANTRPQSCYTTTLLPVGRCWHFTQHIPDGVKMRYFTQQIPDGVKKAFYLTDTRRGEKEVFYLTQTRRGEKVNTRLQETVVVGNPRYKCSNNKSVEIPLRASYPHLFIKLGKLNYTCVDLVWI